MTVAEIREMMKDLPPDMIGVILVDGRFTAAICRSKSGIVNVPDGSKFEQSLLLQPCMCSSSIEIADDREYLSRLHKDHVN